MLKKIQKKAFAKLYRYYGRKLLGQWFIILITLLYSFLLMWVVTFFFGKINKVDGWQGYLLSFWFVSFFQLFASLMFLSQSVSKLVGLYFDYSSGFSFRGFGNYKKSNTEDIMALVFTPDVNRETVMVAKHAAVFTGFFLFNLIFTLPLTLYFLFSFSLLVAVSFLLLNGLVFALANFLLVVPYLFYLYENYSILSFLILYVIIIPISFSGNFFRETIFRYPLLLPLIFIPLSVLVGHLFFSLYRKKFLKKDFG